MMKNYHIGEYKSILAFVRNKIDTLNSSNKQFADIYQLMFSEKENIMYERSIGYRIEKFSYGEVYDDINHRAGYLAKLLADYPKGSVVGIYMKNSLDWIEIFWSILQAGYNPLLMNLLLEKKIVEQSIIDSKCVCVISDEMIFSVKTFLADEIKKDQDICQNKEFGQYVLVTSSGTSSHLKICGYRSEQFVALINDSYQIILENPKMRKHYHENIKLLCFLPFYHIFGLVAVYFWFAFFSRTFVQLNDNKPETIINTINRHQVTHIFAVPLFWNKVYQQALRTIKQKGEKTYRKFNKAFRIVNKTNSSLLAKLFFKEVRENMFSDSISFMITGGSNISNEVLTFFNTIGYHFANGYGSSEIGIAAVELDNNKYYLNNGFIGKGFDSFSFKIDQQGQLLVKGKASSSFIIEDGVYRDNDDYYNTKDLASCTNGHYQILGRKDDVIIPDNGENINPNLIEPQLEFESVNQVALIKDCDGQPVLLVSVSLTAQIDKLNEKIKARLQQLNLNCVNKIVYTFQQLITDNDFKINHYRLSDDYINNRIELITKQKEIVREDNEILNKIREIFSIVLRKDEQTIDYDSDFFLDESGSSLDYFELISVLQQEFAIDIDYQNNSLHSVRDFYFYIVGDHHD